MKFSIYRFDPDVDQKPRMQEFELASDVLDREMMLLDALLMLKAQDETLSFRRSCGEGVCGSDGMNVNGRNMLACITPLYSLKSPIEIRPMPGLPVKRDLVVDMTQFYKQYRAVKPYLVNKDPEPEVEHRQSPEERDKLDGLYECILCGCCSTSCSGLQPCYSPGASWQTVVTMLPMSAWPILRGRSSCFAVTPS
jgi:succinate dehydrogenase / fumarate reductase iron-sulfur subunit